jgi:hypothetical protein
MALDLTNIVTPRSLSIGVSIPGVHGPTSKIVAACPSPDELARDGTQRGENRGSCYPAPEWVRLQ